MKISKKIKKELIKLGVFAICLFGVFNYIIKIFVVPTGSMNPTIHPGDFTVNNAWAYMIGEPQRGDVVTFEGDDKMLVKRIIGTPNDTVSFVDGKVIVNGEVLEEEYLTSNVRTFSPKTFVVPEGHYFVLGDNRMNSLDSRYMEQPYIERSRIKAKLMFVIPVSEVTDVFCAEQHKKDSAQAVLLGRKNVFSILMETSMKQNY